MDIEKIKELALANGFKLKEQASGNMDLNSYVYDFANETAKNMAKLPIASLKQTKALMKQNLSEILEWIDEEAEIFMQRVKSPELHEAVNAFLEKREADFSKFN